jgi:hypothetical protein
MLHFYPDYKSLTYVALPSETAPVSERARSTIDDLRGSTGSVGYRYDLIDEMLRTSMTAGRSASGSCTRTCDPSRRSPTVRSETAMSASSTRS